jgi:hypothetical protein
MFQYTPTPQLKCSVPAFCGLNISPPIIAVTAPPGRARSARGGYFPIAYA